MRGMQRSAESGVVFSTGAMKSVAVALVLGLGQMPFAATGEETDLEVIKSHGISTFGELAYDIDFPHLNYVNPDAPKGGEISLWGFGDFDSLNPYAKEGRAAALSSVMYESMLEGVADEVGSAYGLLAESIEYPVDRTWTIYNLRPEARFSDGSPLTAEDVEFSYELLLEQGLPSFAAVLARVVESVEIENPHRIRFNFKTEGPTRDHPITIGSIPVFSKAWFERTGSRLDKPQLEAGIGSGAYVFDNYQGQKRVSYRRDEGYWGSHLPITQGRFNFDKIRVEYFQDSTAAFEAFKAGTYTFRNENFSKLWATSYEFPAINDGTIVKKTLPDGNIASGQAFIINMRREKFSDIRVRKAIGLMFNFEWSNETLFYGLYARINSIWENSTLAATGMPGEDELALLEPIRDLIPETVFTEPVPMAPVSGQRKLDRGNLRKASDLLDEAGWIVGDDGMRRNAEGNTLDVEFLENSQGFDRIVNPFVENLRALGVNAVYSRVDPSQYTSRSRNFDFDIITDSIGQGYRPGSGLKQYFGSETAAISVFNTSGIANEGIDKLIEDVIAADNIADLTVAVRALDRVLRSFHFWIPQWFKDVHTVAYQDIYEHPPIPPFALGQLDFWWYKGPAEAE